MEGQQQKLADKANTGKAKLSLVPVEFTIAVLKETRDDMFGDPRSVILMYESLAKAAHAPDKETYETHLYRVVRSSANVPNSGGQALCACARAMEFGADKYSRNNWKNGFIWSHMIDACQRHLLPVMYQHPPIDEESGLHHMDHVFFCVAMLLEMFIKGCGVNDIFDEEEENNA